MSEPTPVTVDRPLDAYTITVVDEVLVSLIMRTKFASDARVLKKARDAIAELGPIRSEPCS